jgi:hypothetical protein
MTRQTARQLVMTEVVEAAPKLSPYEQGKRDYFAGVYNPPHNSTPEFAVYLMAYNDAWAKANGRTILR